MAITINGSANTVAGLAVGGLPDGTVDTDSLAANAATGAKIAMGSDAAGDVLYYNGTDYIRLAKGTDGQVLTLASGVPTWATPTVGVSDAQQFRLTADQAGANSANYKFTALEEVDTVYARVGSGIWSHSSGVFSCSKTGVYFINWNVLFTNTTTEDAFDPNISISTDSGSAYDMRSQAWGKISSTDNMTTTSVGSSMMLDVNNTSTLRLRFNESNNNSVSSSTTIQGHTNRTTTHITFIRLGDT